MPHFKYLKRTFISPVSSGTGAYIIAEVESSLDGTYCLGTNLLTIADCRRQVELEFFLGTPRERKRSLAKAKLLADAISTFYQALLEESKQIDKANEKSRNEATKKFRKNLGGQQS